VPLSSLVCSHLENRPRMILERNTNNKTEVRQQRDEEEI